MTGEWVKVQYVLRNGDNKVKAVVHYFRNETTGLDAARMTGGGGVPLSARDGHVLTPASTTGPFSRAAVVAM